MLPELYHAHLSENLTRSNYLLTILLIQVVQSIKEVTLESIATKLAMPIKFESRRKKVQRFLSDDEWDLDNIWLPLVVAWIKGSIKQNNIISALYSTAMKIKPSMAQAMATVMAMVMAFMRKDIMMKKNRATYFKNFTGNISGSPEIKNTT